MTLITFFRLAQVLFICIILSFPASSQGKGAWPEISLSELRLSQGVVDPLSDAEALNWEVRIEDSYFRTTGYRTTLDHYLRVKVFTERGREKFSKFEIPFGKIEDLRLKVEIKDIAARTVTPDGKMKEVNPADIFEQDSVRADGLKLRTKSFAMPGITQGSIVEFRWREIRSNSLSNYVRIQYWRDIPVQRVKYSVKPVAFPGGALAMRIHSANLTNGFVREKDDFYSVTVTGVSAYRSEPRMRTPYQSQPWSLIYYADPKLDTQGTDEYWSGVAKRNYEVHAKLLKFEDAILRAAEQAVAGAENPDEKAKRIFEFCRRNIKNVSDEEDGSKPPTTSSEVLKRRSGTWHDINMLFGSMLNAIGIEARVANVTRRDDPQFDKSLANDYFLRTEVIAAKLGKRWAFFDFSNKHLAYGVLPAPVEGQTVLISGTVPEWTESSKTPAGSSVIRRTANAELKRDGSIEGDIQLSFSGHPGGAYKKRLENYSIEAREKWLTELIKNNINSLSELTNISFQGLESSEAPLSVRFRLRIPGYANATGRRLFLHPNIFKRNVVPEFSSGTRYHDISFDYPWTEVDELKIRIPQEFEIEGGETPQTTVDDGISISNRITIDAQIDSSQLSFTQEMTFEGKNGLIFDQSVYSRIKGVFDNIDKASEHMVVLRQK